MFKRRKICFLTTTNSENYLIDGVNIFDGVETERTCKVRDPSYGKRHTADIYEIIGKTRNFKVAITEYSTCVYGIYSIEE